MTEASSLLNEYFYMYNERDVATGRRTYIKELEQLGVNGKDLLVGIGRALSESVHRSEVINLLLTITMDKQLDFFNRMNMAYILLSCNQELANTPGYQANLERTKQAVATLPEGFQKSLAEFARVIAD